MGKVRLDFRPTRSVHVSGTSSTFKSATLNDGKEISHDRDLARGYLKHLTRQGKKERTLYTYGKDLEQNEAFFGASRKLTGILAPHVGKFFRSDALLKLPSGKERSQPTVEKTKRVLRMFLIWAQETGQIDVEEAGGGSVFGQADPEGSVLGKLLGPANRRRAVMWVRERLGAERVSERRACQVLGQVRSTQRRERQIPDDEARLVARMVELATQYGRYGYRRVTAILHGEGWKVNPKRVERLWRQEGLKVPSRQPKRRRLWLNDGFCVRLRAARKNHVWSYDFVHERTHDGRAFRLLTILDEYTRECLAIDVKRQMNHQDVLDRLAELFVDRGVPEFIRSDPRCCINRGDARRLVSDGPRCQHEE